MRIYEFYSKILEQYEIIVDRLDSINIINTETVVSNKSINFFFLSSSYTFAKFSNLKRDTKLTK